MATPAVPNQQHITFLRNFCAAAKAGLAALTTAQANVQTYSLLAYGDPSTGITATDLAGQFADLAPADVAAAVAAFQAVETALNANNSAALAALMKVAR